MQIGALTAHGDVAEVVLGAFGVFFFGLVYYLQRESNREGFPLVDHNGQAMASTGLCGVPAPKYFYLPHGGVVSAPRAEAPEVVTATQIAGFPGAPLEASGNKLTANLGPAAFANRADVPDVLFDGAPRIVPLAADPAYSLAVEGPNPIGWPIAGADGVVAGTILDAWVDRSETMLRYLEIALSPALGGRRVLVPSTMVDIQDNAVVAESILGAQFADVPATKSTTQVTLLEEDAISAYYAGGTLYATPARSEPLI